MVCLYLGRRRRKALGFHSSAWSLVCTGNDPLNDKWEVAGRIMTQWDTFSLDATLFEHKGQRYFVWCQVEPDKQGTHIMIAKMKSPTELEDKQVILSRPEYPWEQQVYWVNECRQ